jgi:hypothetical protein
MKPKERNMLIVTNRNINKKNFKNGIGNEAAFGDEVNSKGPNEVRLAHAKKVSGKWEVRLVKEPSVITENNIPSRKEFNVFRNKLIKKKKNCVFFVHGFNQSFEKSLDNVIICQADVDNEGHARWVDTIEAGKRVYITINENDWVLKWSDANFQKDRLGRTARNLNARIAAYFDFTDGPNVGKTHGLFYKKTNDVVKEFFATVLNGGQGDRVRGFVYDSRTNTYRF